MPEEIVKATEETVEEMIEQKVVDPGTKALATIVCGAFTIGTVFGATMGPKIGNGVKKIASFMTKPFHKKKEKEDSETETE